MARQQATRTERGRRWTRTSTSSARSGGLRPRGRQSAGRRKQSSARSPLAFASGLLRSGGKGKAKGSNASRKGPALLAVFGGLGAAGAAAFKRRQTRQHQSNVTPSQAPVGRESPPPEAA